jgi:hypothetical protein
MQPISEYIDSIYTKKPGGDKIVFKKRFDSDFNIINYYLSPEYIKYAHNYEMYINCEYDNPRSYYSTRTTKEFTNSFTVANDNYIKKYCGKKMLDDAKITNCVAFLNLVKLLLLKLLPTKCSFTRQLIYTSINLNKYNSIYMKDNHIRSIFFYSEFKEKEMAEIIEITNKLGLNFSDLHIYTKFENFISYKHKEEIVPTDNYDFITCAYKTLKITKDNISAIMKYDVHNLWISLCDQEIFDALKLNPNEVLELYASKNNILRCWRFNFVSAVLKYDKLKELSNSALLLLLSKFKRYTDKYEITSRKLLDKKQIDIYKTYIQNKIGNNDFTICVINIAANKHYNSILNDCVDKGCSITNDIITKYLCGQKDSGNYSLEPKLLKFSSTLANLILNTKNLNIVDIIKKCKFLRHNNYYNPYNQIIINQFSKIVTPTYDIFKLYIKYFGLVEFTSMEKYGLKLNSDVYNILYGNNARISVNYLENFTHVSKQTLATRALFYDDRYYFGEDCVTDFVLQNLGFKKLIKGVALRKEFIDNMKTVDGYTLQNIYDNYNCYYCGIKDKYSFVPFKYREEIDYKLLECLYERK